MIAFGKNFNTLVNFVKTLSIGLFKDIKLLLQKEIRTEIRQKAAVNGILLYVISTVFVAFLVFNHIEDLTTWIALFWIILLFASTNASINSFRAESGSQFFYYYQLCSPQSIILSKLIFNGLLLVLIGLINWLFFSLLLGSPLQNNQAFLGVLILASLGFSGILTLVSGIASKTNNNSTLTAILAFPIMLPMLLTSVKASVLIGLGFGSDEWLIYLGTMGLMNLVIIALAFILFPYLWRS